MHASIREECAVTLDAAQWVVAADELRRHLTGQGTDGAYESIADRVAELAGCDFVALVVPEPGATTVTVVASAGIDTSRWHGMTLAAEGTMAGSVLRTGRGCLARDAAGVLGDDLGPPADGDSVLAVPLAGETVVRAVLIVGRRVGRAPFTETDLALVTLFAGQLALTLAHHDADSRIERVVLAGERDRIARGMQNQVIAPLFALGMRLQGAASHATGASARHLEAGSDEIDETLKSIRTTIYRFAE